MGNTRIEVYDESKRSMRPFMDDALLRNSSIGTAWDDVMLVEHLSLPPGEMFDCCSGGYTLVQHLQANRIERLDSAHDLMEKLAVGPHMVQLDPPHARLGVRWVAPQEVLIMIPREATIQRTLLEINRGRMPDFLRASGVNDPQIAQIGLALLAEIQSGSRSGRLFGESLTIALVARLVTCFANVDTRSPTADRGLQGWRLKRTTEYINDNIGEDLSLTALADVAGISQYYFCRLFKQSTGLTPHKYIMGQRIVRARELLRSSKLSIAKISADLGFADQTHFAVSFRRATQITPTEFRYRS